MLNMTKSTISRSVERPVADGFSINAEGSALVGVVANGAFGLRPSTGAAGEKFAGVSMSQVMVATFLPRVDTLVVPAAGATEVDLTADPVPGTTRFVIGATVLVAGDPGANAGEYTLVGRKLTVHASHAGEEVTALYRYSPTVAEAQAMQGDVAPGAAAASILGSVGTIEVGDVYTTEYDTTADWSGASPVVRLGANGLFTTSGSGTVVNAMVIQVPSSTDSLLGLRISA